MRVNEGAHALPFFLVVVVRPDGLRPQGVEKGVDCLICFHVGNCSLYTDICQGQNELSRRSTSRLGYSPVMAEVLDRHRILAHQVFMMGELHGREELKKAIAQAIADAEERSPQVVKEFNVVDSPV